MTTLEFKTGTCASLEDVPVTAQNDFEQTLKTLFDDGWHMGDLFAVPLDQPGDHTHNLMAVLLPPDSGVARVLAMATGPTFSSMTPSLPSLHLFEREIAETSHLIPEGHPWFKPVRFPQTQGPGNPFATANGRLPVCGVTNYFQLEGDEVHEVAVGPVHAGVIEPGHFRFQCHGEKVYHLEISLGYQHRGIEAALMGGPYPASIHQIETIAGDTTIGHTTAYCKNIEALTGTTVPDAPKALRALALELERLANHCGDLGALAGDVGYLPAFSYLGRIRGNYLNLTAMLCGSRFGRGLVRPGGAGFQLTSQIISEMKKILTTLERDTQGAIDLLFNAPSCLARFEGCGVVTTENARQLGLVGMAARSSNMAMDARMGNDFEPVHTGFSKPVTYASGDVLARAQTRRDEVTNSLAFVHQILDTFPDGPQHLPVTQPLSPRKIAISTVEGWRGEVVHTALSDHQGRFSRYRVVDPSFHNWSGLALCLRNEQISDFPLCNKSFNLSYCGFDL